MTAKQLVRGLVALAIPGLAVAFEQLPGLAIRGQGCHVELLAPDGGRVCWAVATQLPPCASFTAFRSGQDGGLTVGKYRLGSTCPEPRLTSASLGSGGFFVEKEGVVFQVICDDAPSCQRGAFTKPILACCERDETIRGTSVCNVTPQVGVCVGENGD
jgi:hypothetical protein